MNQPTPDEIKEARKKAGLTQTAAASLVHKALRSWQQWEAGDRKIDLDTWELFLIKTNQIQNGATMKSTLSMVFSKIENDQIVLIDNPQHDEIRGSCHELVWNTGTGQFVDGVELTSGFAGILIYPPCYLSKKWKIDTWIRDIDRGVTLNEYDSKEELLAYASEYYKKFIKPVFN